MVEMTAKRQTKVSIWPAGSLDNEHTLDMHQYNHILYQQLYSDKNICPIIWLMQL